MFQTPQGTRNLRSASPSGGLKQSQFSMRNNNYNNNNNSQQIQQTNSSSSKTSKLPKLLNEEKGTNQDNLVIDVGVCSLQGRRPYQEDQFAVCRFLKDPTTQSENTPETHFFGVFDGHAGGKCSKAICTTIPYQFCRDESFLTKVPIALRKAIQRTNEQFLEVAGRMRLNDGSTAVCVVLRGLTMTISNVGDSRAVLISGKKGIPLTEDHKPSSPSEQKRIASFGGTVTYNTGIARVAGVLAVSRAFGNYSIRNLIRADPDITERELTSQDDFVVLASDGLWDVFSANEVAEVCYSWQRYGVNRIADQLVQLALTRGSMDNVTAIVVSLSKYISRMLQQQQSQFQSYNNVNVGNGNNSNGNVGNNNNNNNNNNNISQSQSQSQQRAATASSVINASLRPDSGYSRRKNEDNNNGSNGNNVGREGIDQDKEDDDNLIGDDATITEYESTIIGISSTSEMVSDNPNPARRRSQSSSAANANHHSNFHNQNQNINNSNHSNLNINLNKYSSTFSSISGKTNQNHNSNYNFEDDSPADSGVVHSGRSESIMNSGRSTSRSGTPSNDRKLTLLSTNFSQQNSNDSSTSFITPVQSKRSQYSSSNNNNNNNNNNTLSTIPLYTNNNNNNNMKKSSSSNNNNNNSLSTTLPLSTVPNINSNGMGGGGIFNNNNHNNNNNNNNNNNVSNNGSSGTGTTGNLFSKTLGAKPDPPLERIYSPIISNAYRKGSLTQGNNSRPNTTR